MFVFASVNLAQRTNWASRVPHVLSAMRHSLAASVYSFQETDYGMAEELASAMRWGSSGQPSWRTDENRNTVAWDPKKWRDLRTHQTSLTRTSGDLGDRHFRSANYVELQHRATGIHYWFGSAHLSNGGTAGPARAEQAKALVTGLPDGPRILLGIDRNSLATSEPASILRAHGLDDLTRGRDPRRSYPVGDSNKDGKQIDAVHGTILIKGATLVEMVGATDHRAWRVEV